MISYYKIVRGWPYSAKKNNLLEHLQQAMDNQNMESETGKNKEEGFNSLSKTQKIFC